MMLMLAKESATRADEALVVHANEFSTFRMQQAVIVFNNFLAFCWILGWLLINLLLLFESLLWFLTNCFFIFFKYFLNFIAFFLLLLVISFAIVNIDDFICSFRLPRLTLAQS